MFRADLADATSLLQKAVDALRTNAPDITDDDQIAALLATRELFRLVEQVQVESVAAMDRHGVFIKNGHPKRESPIATALNVEHRSARRITRAAEQVCARVDLQGQKLAPVLPATAAAFASGAASLEHVDVVARLMVLPAARRLSPQVWAICEEHIAAQAEVQTPAGLWSFGRQLLEQADQDGAEPSDKPDAQVNELRLTPLPGGGGKFKGVIQDPVRWAELVTVIDAKSAPLTAEDDRSLPERQADALIDALGFVLEHGHNKVMPSIAGHRPTVTVTTALTDLENRGTAGCLDIGGITTPDGLRMLCCDARVIPVVLGDAGQPLDVGRSRRTISEPIRRAVTVRDRGCAHPGCDRPPSWAEIHHIRHWAKGGHTRLDNLVMLCRVHHREIHSSNWIVRIASDGIPEFIPPEWLDKNQTPRRHARIPSHSHSHE